MFKSVYMSCNSHLHYCIICLYLLYANRYSEDGHITYLIRLNLKVVWHTHKSQIMIEDGVERIEVIVMWNNCLWWQTRTLFGELCTVGLTFVYLFFLIQFSCNFWKQGKSVIFVSSFQIERLWVLTLSHCNDVRSHLQNISWRFGSLANVSWYL